MDINLAKDKMQIIEKIEEALDTTPLLAPGIYKFAVNQCDWETGKDQLELNPESLSDWLTLDQLAKVLERTQGDY